MNTNPSVSIILPTYNRAHLVGRAIKSILAQTFQDFELIVVDDGSTDDDTAAIVRAFDDPRIRYLKEPHRGAAAARNTGISAARAALVAFQDSDDEWFPQKLALQIEVIQKAPQTVGLVYAAFYKITKEGKKMLFPPSHLKKKEGNLYRELLEDNFITTQAALVRKRCLEEVGGFDEQLPGMQEWELWLRIAQRYEFFFISTPLLITYYTKESITAHRAERLRAKEIIFRKHEKEFRRYPLIYMHHAFTIGRAKLLRGDWKGGLFYFLRIPFNILRYPYRS